MKPTPIKETKTVPTEEIVGVNVPLKKDELHDLLILSRHFPWDLAEDRFGLLHVSAAYYTLGAAWDVLSQDNGPHRLGMERTIREAFEALDEKNERRSKPNEECVPSADPDIVILMMNRNEAETFRRILGAMSAHTVVDIGGDSGVYIHLLDRMNWEIVSRKWNSLYNSHRLTAQPIS